MELVVAAEKETGQLASDEPGPPIESTTTEGTAKTEPALAQQPHPEPFLAILFYEFALRFSS
jgi:hypothetical protein